jgi:hypothetical protein
LRRRRRRRHVSRLIVCTLSLLAAAVPARAQTGWGSAQVQNWGYFQKNENGSNQWKYQPRLLLPYGFDSGATFTERVDVPMIDTNATGAGNPDGGYAFGFGDMFIEEILESAEVAPNLRLKTSVRFILPTGKQSPFGSSQYQWALGGGVIYAMPDVLQGVTLQPYVRWFSGFRPLYDNVSEMRKLELYPAATFVLPDRWSLLLVPLDFMLSRRIDRTFELGMGGAFKLGNPSDPSYRSLIDARLSVNF